MPVDPELLPILAAMSAGPRLGELPLAQLREGPPPFPMGAPAEMAEVVDLRVSNSAGAVPARLYRPRDVKPLPLLVYFHGGGFVLGSIDSHDTITRALAREADCAVMSVGYRLAPEHRFPAAVEDCIAAVRWAHAHASELGVDTGRIAVGGDSAGGNLATVVAIHGRDEGCPPIAAQLLIYPVTRLRAPAEGSMRENGRGYFLEADDMSWFESHYLGESGGPDHPDASPLLAPSLSRLPPAFVLTAEFDPLRDQGEEYAARMRDAGVEVSQARYAGAIHGFFGMPIALGQRALTEAADWLKTRLRRAPG
ncbi:MAG TPA: alpha/beta hydrolase [Steroidobacteraceae bacterium]|nr:alpha/beta hydrolase [Steroidobacteraceae bacterium]